MVLRKKERLPRRSVAVVLLAAALVTALTGNAGAGSPFPINCHAAGYVLTTPGTPDSWTLVGQGSCFGDFEGTYALSFTGAGTSQGLGLCSDPTLPFIVTNLNIVLTGSLTNLADLSVKPITQRWSAPLTTYPLGTPFLVSKLDGTFLGGGNFLNHIFLNCSGSPVAWFDWVFLT